MADEPQADDTRAARVTPERRPRHRTEFERDRDRVLYSSAFARLAGITQVATTAPGGGFHNRLTHTLKVGQLTSRLAKVLRKKYKTVEAAAALEPEAAEAAAFAHDLGHAPFGHIGEETLGGLANRLGCGGFEANAQSFRIVTHLARRDVMFPGLNLTRLTLDGILKYPWLRPAGASDETIEGRKWGAYHSELGVYNHARGRPSDAPAITSSEDPAATPSLTALVVTWADDVTYAIHDLEDFYRAGLIPLNDLVWRPDEADAFLQSFLVNGDLRPKFEGFTKTQIQGGLQSLQETFAIGLDRPYDRSNEVRAVLRFLSSQLIGEFFDAVALTTDPRTLGLKLEMEEDDRALPAQIAVLHEMLYFYVINRPQFAVVQHGQRRVIEGLVEMMLDAAEDSGEWRVFPQPVHAALRDGPGSEDSTPAAEARARIIIDYVAGMTELEAMAVYRAISGQDPHDLLG